MGSGPSSLLSLGSTVGLIHPSSMLVIFLALFTPAMHPRTGCLSYPPLLIVGRLFFIASPTTA